MKTRKILHALRAGTITLPVLPAAAMLLLAGFPLPQMAQEAAQIQPTAKVNGPVTANPPREIVLGDLPQITRADIANYRQAPPARNPYFNDAQLKAIKAHAATAPAITRPEDAAHIAAPRAAESISDNEVEPPTPPAFENFQGANEDLSCGGLTPSDMGLAVSPAWVLQTVNACVSVYTTTGTLQAGFPKTLDAFLGWPAGTFTFDPRATYDVAFNRFIVTASTVDSSNAGWWNIAVSKNGDPRGGYYVYQFNEGTNVLVDFPTLGQNWGYDGRDGAIYTCANIFTNSAFTDAMCLYLPKTLMYSGQGFSYYFTNNFNYGGTILDTIQPANVAEPGSKPRAEFAIDSINTNGGGACGNNPCHGVIVWSFANTLAGNNSPGPVVAGIFVSTPSAYSYPASADTPFCTNCIDTNDNRISGMLQYSAGRLFPSINVANGGTSAVLGWIIRPFLNDNGGNCTGVYTNACPTITGATVEQEYCDYCGAGHGAAAYYGAVTPTNELNWTMGATFSNQSLSPGLFYVSNRVTWQTPFHDSGIFACQANNNYTQGRWGDYNAAAPQININFPAVWVSGMWVMSDGNWGTCIAGDRYNSVEDP